MNPADEVKRCREHKDALSSFAGDLHVKLAAAEAASDTPVALALRGQLDHAREQLAEAERACRRADDALVEHSRREQAQAREKRLGELRQKRGALVAQLQLENAGHETSLRLLESQHAERRARIAALLRDVDAELQSLSPVDVGQASTATITQLENPDNVTTEQSPQPSEPDPVIPDPSADVGPRKRGSRARKQS